MGSEGKGSDTVTVQEVPALDDIKVPSSTAPRGATEHSGQSVASFAVGAGEARLVPGSVNCNVRGFTVSLHLGYFLAVASFMALINLGKRIYCQKQEPPRAFLTLPSSRVTEREVWFACTVDT